MPLPDTLDQDELNAIGELKDLELLARLQIKFLPYLFGDHNLELR